MTAKTRTRLVAGLAASAFLAVSQLQISAATQDPQQAPAARPAQPQGCRVTGKVTSMVTLPPRGAGRGGPGGAGQGGQGRGGAGNAAGARAGAANAGGRGNAATTGGAGSTTGAAGTTTPPAGATGDATPPAQPAAPTRVASPLPGAAVVVFVGQQVKAATSTDIDGKYTIIFGPNATYHVTAELMAFRKVEKDLTLGALPCDTTLDFDLSLVPRDEPLPNAAPATTPAVGAPTTPPAAGQPPAGAGQTAQTGAAGAAGATATGAAGRAGAPQNARAGGAGQPAAGRGGQGFTQLNVNTDETGAAVVATTPPDQQGDIARLLPPGFSLQGANADAVQVSSGDAMSVDRGVLNDRMNMIGRGEFDPATGQFAAGFGPTGDQAGGRGGGLNGGGDAFGGGGGGRGGGGGPGGFQLGGRGGRGQSLYQGSANYTYGGSALDATNLQPRNGVITPVSSLPFARNNFGGTIGGPLIIPGLYKDTNRRTNFQINYSGSHSTNLQDQYATVPTEAMRNGDFSGSTVQLINPLTGTPFTDNQIPKGAMDQAALSLLSFIPSANVPGVTTNNYHTAATTLSTSNSISATFRQNLTPNIGNRGRGGPGGAAGGGGRGGAGGGGGRAGGGANGRGGRGLTMNLSVQVQYRENNGQNFNVIPQLGGTTKSTNFAMPISFTMAKGRTNNTFSLNWAHSKSTSSNLFSNVTNVAGDAGIQYPDPQDPLNWGLPNLTFSNFNLRSSAANQRDDNRITSSYTYSRPFGRHQIRIGADFSHDASNSISNGNARGGFTFTGLYTTNGLQVPRGSGADFADFLLGMPQQATLQVGGTTRLREKRFSTYLEDNWQKNSKMTFNLGVRWEVLMPYVEASGHMANLDVNQGFTAASVALPGQVGALSGVTYPTGIIKTDWNNIAPAVGMAYRVAKGLVIYPSYRLSFNTSSYASIAQKLVQQPPFSATETNAGTLLDPLTLETALLSGISNTTNNFGVTPNYSAGLIQTWNTTAVKQFARIWSLTLGYTGTKGSNLDLLQAPNRLPDGTLAIPDVQAFTYQSTGGHSITNAGVFSLQRGMAHGMRFGVSYTLSKSMDNGGAGSTFVAQDPTNPDAEWAISSFNQTHIFSANMTYELPFGVGRKWLNNGGFWAGVMGEWSMNLNFAAHSGSPFTIRVVGATSSVGTGTSGSLRADLVPGQSLQLTNPALLDFFNTAAFSVPAVGEFGNSGRDIVTGPGGHVLNASFSRNMRLGRTRSMSINININNLLNTIQWSSVDTNINSATFGQVTRFASMRTMTIALRFGF